MFGDGEVDIAPPVYGGICAFANIAIRCYNCGVAFFDRILIL